MRGYISVLAPSDFPFFKSDCDEESSYIYTNDDNYDTYVPYLPLDLPM